MICLECFKPNLDLIESYLDTDYEKKAVYLVEVYKCSDCHKIRTVKKFR